MVGIVAIVSTQQYRAKVILFSATQDVELPNKLAQTHKLLVELVQELASLSANTVVDRSTTMRLDLLHLLVQQFSPSAAASLNSAKSPYFATLLQVLDFTSPLIRAAAIEDSLRYTLASALTPQLSALSRVTGELYTALNDTNQRALFQTLCHVLQSTRSADEVCAKSLELTSVCAVAVCGCGNAQPSFCTDDDGAALACSL
jgi:hypothetical protein